MANPTTPVISTFPVPPPAPQLTDIRLNEGDNSGKPTPQFQEWKQLIWAAIQGGGGLVDQVLVNQIASLQAQISGLGELINGLQAQIAAGRASADGAETLGLLSPSVGAMDMAELLGLMRPPTPVSSAGITLATGTFTPVLAGSTVAGAPTYTAQVGTYMIIGTYVFFTVDLEINTVDGTATGDALIMGLPFPASGDYGCAIATYQQVSHPGSSDTSFWIKSGTSRVAMYHNEAGAGLAVAIGDVGNSAVLKFTGFYAR